MAALVEIRPLPSRDVRRFAGRKAGRPVRITFDREEVYWINRGRHPSHIDVKMMPTRRVESLALTSMRSLTEVALPFWARHFLLQGSGHSPL